MREEYDFSNAKKNPYAKKLKSQITINIDSSTIDYFRELADNLYLRDCVTKKREIQISWN